MSRKLVFSIFLVLFFSQVSCAPTHINFHDSNTVNGPVYGHESDTVYGVDMLDQTMRLLREGLLPHVMCRLNGKILRRKGARD